MEKILDNPIKLPAIKKSTSSRVKEYLKAYSASNLSTSKNDQVRPIKLSKEDNSTRSHIIRNQISNKVEKLKMSEDVKRRNDLIYEISVAKSDKLEILRDLSTYECNLSTSINLTEKLAKLDDYLGTLPINFSQFYQLTTETDKISLLLQEGFKSINTLESTQISNSLESEEFKVRTYNTLRKMRLLYKSVKKISGVRVLISVKGDTFFENFLISLATADCEVCINVPVKLDILAVDTLNQSVEMTSAIESKILPYLYLVYSNRKLQVKFDENFQNEKISVVFNLRNWGYTSAILWQIEESIVISVTDPKSEKKVNKNSLLNFDQSLNSIQFKELSSSLSAHLRYNKIREGEELEWVESIETIFQKKESASKLMNEEYIKESLGTQAFNRIWEQEIVVNGIKYFIQCFSYHSLRKILIGNSGKSFEIKPESQAYKYIVGLQSIDIGKHPTTLCTSLELKKLIKSYFLYSKTQSLHFLFLP